MKYRKLSVVSFVLLSCATAFGQTTFKGLTPGKSTRTEVERGLGKPIKEHTATLVEYPPQNQTGRIFVQYRPGPDLVERFEFLCRAAGSSCDNLIRSLKLSTSVMPYALNSSGDGSGKVVRYYYPPQYFATTIDDESEGSFYLLTPARVALYSPELYDAAIADEKRKKDPEQLTVTSLRFFESGIDSVPFEDRDYRHRFSGEGTRYQL